MKVLIAGLATETNSFAPLPTGAQAFEEAFPRLPVIWLELEHGGTGLFLITAADLAAN